MDAVDYLLDMDLAELGNCGLPVDVDCKRDVLTILVAVVGDQKEVGQSILSSRAVRQNMHYGIHRTHQNTDKNFPLLAS